MESASDLPGLAGYPPPLSAARKADKMHFLGRVSFTYTLLVPLHCPVLYLNMHTRQKGSRMKRKSTGIPIIMEESLEVP